MAFTALIDLGTVGEDITGSTVSLSGCTGTCINNVTSPSGCSSIATNEAVSGFTAPGLTITGIDDNVVSLWIKVDNGPCSGTTQCIGIDFGSTPTPTSTSTVTDEPGITPTPTVTNSPDCNFDVDIDVIFPTPTPTETPTTTLTETPTLFSLGVYLKDVGSPQGTNEVLFYSINGGININVPGANGTQFPTNCSLVYTIEDLTAGDEITFGTSNLLFMDGNVSLSTPSCPTSAGSLDTTYTVSMGASNQNVGLTVNSSNIG